MTRYFVYRVMFDDADYLPNQAVAIIDDHWCVCDDLEAPTEYTPTSEIGDLVHGRLNNYKILLDTTNIEEFLEAECTTFVEPTVLNSIKGACL